MDQLLKPAGEVVAEHSANVAWRIVSVVLLGIPAATWLTAAWSGPRENAALLSIPGAVLIALCVLVFVQQGKVRVVLRTDGVERWGLRGELWTLRWEDATQLRYQATRVHAVGLDLMLLLKLFPGLGKSVKISFVDVNGKRRKLPSSLKAMDVLAERVIERHTAAQFPALRSALDRGEEVRLATRYRSTGSRSRCGSSSAARNAACSRTWRRSASTRASSRFAREARPSHSPASPWPRCRTPFSS